MIRGAINYCRGFFFRFLNRCHNPLFFLLPLQPRGMKLAKFLVINQQTVFNVSRPDKWWTVPLAFLHPAAPPCTRSLYPSAS